MQSPVKKIYITQIFGANPDAYAKFGYKGHNGIDYRAFLPNGERCYEGGKSEVFAPHDGKVIENAYDANGYGNYIKIENDKEGSVLAHFSSLSPKKVGETVKTGELIGYQGTTGNSTGIHLHWGYYLHPRNRSNGYGGFINQEGMYTPYGGTMSDSMTIEKSLFEKLVRNSEQWDKTCREYLPDRDPNTTPFEDVQRVVSGYKSRVTDLENQLNSTKIEYEKAKTEIENQKDKLANELASCQRTIDKLKADISTKDKLIKTLQSAGGSYSATIQELEGKLREAEKAGGLKDLEITDLKTRLENCRNSGGENNAIVQSLELLVQWFKRLWNR